MDEKPSKTQRKRDMQALQALGERLVELTEHQLEKIPLPEDLAEAVHEARGMHKRGALYRQKQYIGKLMRRIDSAPIADAIEQLDALKREQISVFKQAEHWRDTILKGSPEAIEAFMEAFPDADRQQLKHWKRQYDRDRNSGKTPRATKLLFRYVHSLLEGQ